MPFLSCFLFHRRPFTAGAEFPLLLGHAQPRTAGSKGLKGFNEQAPRAFPFKQLSSGKSRLLSGIPLEQRCHDRASFGLGLP